MLSKKIVSLLSICALGLTSCATIISGTRQSVSIASNPAHAAVFLDRQFVGHTPLILEMTRKDMHVVNFELPGYYPYEVIFTRKLNGWVFGNILFGEFIGLAIDAISGGIYKLTPSQVDAELISQNVAYKKASKDSHIAIVLEPKPEWEKIGSLQPLN